MARSLAYSKAPGTSHAATAAASGAATAAASGEASAAASGAAGEVRADDMTGEICRRDGSKVSHAAARLRTYIYAIGRADPNPMASSDTAPDPVYDLYDPARALRPFGLRNTGVICYFNALLQAVGACTQAVAAARAPADGPRTRTGAALAAFFAAAEGGAAPDGAAVLAALAADLAARRPGVRFGAGMESASEALVHLLDMAEPEPAQGAPACAVAADAESPVAVRAAESSPLTATFQHRYRGETWCMACRRLAARSVDNGVQVALFGCPGAGGLSGVGAPLAACPPRDAASFAAAVLGSVSPVEDYRCEACGVRGPVLRRLKLAYAPPVVVCLFNVYGVGAGGRPLPRVAHYFPPEFELPGADARPMTYRLVAQVEHAGSLSGGHYWARALRADGVYALNDSSASKVPGFSPSPETYLVFYSRTT